MPQEERSRSPVSFTQTDSMLLVRDELAGQTLKFHFESSLTTQRALPNLFHFPVDAAVSLRTDEFTVGPHASALLRNGNGDVVAETRGDPDPSRRGTYYVDVTGKVKTYVRIPDASPTTSYDEGGETLRVSLDEETTITVGARSLHARPAATITVPDDPAARAEALSYLGSSIKEFSPERSWPILRGHPPRFERGPELDVPPELKKPDTGITVTVPATHADLYRVAPLAFYFGATVELGETPALHLPNGYTEPLTTRSQSLEERVHRVVGTCFLLDTLARQDGYVPVTTPTYERVAPHLSFYPEALADEPLSTQILEYLEAPTGPVLDAMPRWPTTAVLRPSVEDIALLPDLLDSMAHIEVAGSPPTPGDVRDRTPSSPLAVAYAHDDVPRGGVALSERAFENRLGADVPEVVDTRVAVVTGDPQQGNAFRDALASAPLADQPAGIEVVDTPTASKLRTALSTADLAVLDRPAEDGVLTCADDELALADLSEFQPTTVVFDADSTDPGTAAAAIDAGATGALTAPAVTDPDTGIRLIGCLLTGHSLGSAAELVYEADSFRLAGAPNTSAVDLDTGANPGYYRAETVASGEFSVDFVTLPLHPYDLGSVNRPFEPFPEAGYQLTGTAERMTHAADTDQVLELLGIEDLVVALNGTVHADEVEPTVSLVDESARRALARTRAAGSERDDAVNASDGPSAE